MKRSVVLAGAILAMPAFLPALSFGQITGFSGFAPVNHTVETVPTANPSLGYFGSGQTFNLTTPVSGQATSGYFPTAQNITSFTAHYDYSSAAGYTDANGQVSGDGVALNFLNPTINTTAALGPGGSGRGIQNITDSASYHIDNFGGFYNFGGRSGTGINGAAPASWRGLGPFSTLNNTVSIDLAYRNGTLVQRLVDNSGPVPKRVTATFNLDIPAAVGGNTALVGFSSGTGFYTSTQSVSNFSFTPGGSAALPTFTPIGIGGFNQTVVVPNTATRLTAFGYVTATPDRGTDLSISATGDTFFETGMQGVDDGGNPNPDQTAALAGKGLPASGSTFTSQSSSLHTFKMPTYNSSGGSGTYVPDSILVDQASPTAVMTLNTPARYSELSFLSTSGNGTSPVGYLLTYSDGSTLDLGSGTSSDWFSSATLAWSAGARLNPGSAAYDIRTNAVVNLYQLDFDLPETDKLVSSITLNFQGPASAHALFFGLSGYLAAPAVGIPGDYNNNGTVDAADYTVWADNFGRTGTNIPGDGNNSGTVDAADYTVWADNFGRTTPPGASVPEPSGLALAGVAGLGLLRRRRR